MKKLVYCSLLFLVPALHAMKDPGIESLFLKEKHLKAIQPVQRLKDDFVDNPEKFNDIKKSFAAFLNKISKNSMVENAVIAYIMARGNNLEMLNNLSPRQTTEYVWFALAAWYGLVIAQEDEYMVFRMPSKEEQFSYGISLEKEIMSIQVVPTLPEYIKAQTEYERMIIGNKDAKRMLSLEDYENSIPKSLFDNSKKIHDDMLQKLLGVYEMYLNPTLKDPTNLLVDIFMAASIKDSKLPGCIGVVKCSLNHMSKLPLCIIQVGLGKEKAQEALNTLYAHIGHKYEGSDSLEYAAKVNSFIFFAQGNRQFKGSKYAKYYDKKGVYYKKNFGGDRSNFHLKPPVKSKKK